MTTLFEQFNSNNNANIYLQKIHSLQSVEKYIVRKKDRKTYRSGAWYVGKLDGTQRIGWGKFKFTNGGCYEGNYKENKRDGDGTYTWSDDSIYVGSFKNDARHGYGELRWKSGETYNGQFYEDMRHGEGVYKWANGATYKGNFRYNRKHGYGVLHLINGDIFEGVYKDDQKCGPGIYTYKYDGAQDVGQWKGNQLIRICSIVAETFLYEYSSDHNINPGKHILQKIKSLNSSPNSSSSSAHLKDAENFAIPEGFPYDEITKGNRTLQTEKGILEKLSEQFLQAASIGDFEVVKRITECGLVNVDVCDRTGYFALLASSVNCHTEILNYLLDNGANINQLTNQRLSSLSACHILLYSEENYVSNIAENMKKENLFNATEVEQKSGSVINRNERKMILSIYEEIYKPYGDRNVKAMKQKADKKGAVRRPSEDTSSKRRTSQEECLENLSRCTEYDTEDITCKYDAWKLDNYHRSMDRVKEVAEINRTFKEIMLNPHTMSKKNVENIDCCSLVGNAASRLSERTYNAAFSDTSKALPTSVASVLGYEATTKSCGDSPSNDIEEGKNNGHVRNLLNSERRPHLMNTIELLLSRGADPSSSSLPMPVLFFPIKSAEPSAVKKLLLCEANTSCRLEHLQLCPLHISVALPCAAGVSITEYLLLRGADPNERDGFFQGDITIGRTPLHVACCREDDYKLARSIVALLLNHGANPDLLCAGNSPLSLAIASGNDLIIDLLLQYNAHTSLKLEQGLGSILCVSVSFQAERKRYPHKRMDLIEKLINAGADMLAPVFISNKLPTGTVVDYAYHVYFQDRRISCTPYHALSSLERECYNARKLMLDKLASYLRASVAVKERELLDLDLKKSPRELSDGDKNFAARKKQPLKISRKSFRNFTLERQESCGLGYVTIKRNQRHPSTWAGGLNSKKRFRYCNECGRSVGIPLAPCPRCKEIFYCSKGCKIKLWNSRHREECSILSGVKSGGSNSGKKASENATPSRDTDRKRSDILANRTREVISDKSSDSVLKTTVDESFRFLPQI